MLNTTLLAPTWVLTSMVQPGLSKLGGVGFDSLHPRSSYSYLSSCSPFLPLLLAASSILLFFVKPHSFSPSFDSTFGWSNCSFCSNVSFSQRLKLLDFYIHVNHPRIFFYLFMFCEIHLIKYKYLTLCKDVFCFRIIIICIFFRAGVL